MEGRRLAPPAAGIRVVFPRPRAVAEHPPTHDHGALRLDQLRDQARVLVVHPALEPVRLAPAPEAEDPLVELLAAYAERVLEVRVRPGDVAVERHADLEGHLRHRS